MLEFLFFLVLQRLYVMHYTTTVIWWCSMHVNVY